MSLKTFSLRSWIRRILTILICILAVGVIFRRLPRQQPLKTHSPSLPVLDSIPDFNLTSSESKTVSLADLAGKVWIADFIFTHCAGPCPLMSGTLSQLVKKFPDDSAVRFVSFSVDPDRDTPEVLAAYAGRYQADPAKWFFLTGDKSQIYQLSNQHFHLGLAEIPPAERESVDQNIRHSTKFVLIDQKGSIRGYYDSGSADEISELVQDAKQLLGKNE